MSIDNQNRYFTPRLVAAYLGGLLFFNYAVAQNIELETNKANKLLATRNEVEIVVKLSKDQFPYIVGNFSVARLRSDSVWIFLNNASFANFLKLNIQFKVVQPAFVKHAGLKAASDGWDGASYPSYTQYLAFCDSLVAKFPNLCTLYNIGLSVNGKKMVCLRITSQNNNCCCKPKVFYTSSMHGNELTGFVLMLKLANYLLANYGKDTLVNELLNNLEIWINPLSNPDGAYNNANGTVEAPQRFNANACDLNRNYPDPRPGPYPAVSGFCDVQPETQAMMDFMAKQHFDLSANFHTGAEVVNYPWDGPWDITWRNTYIYHADTLTHPDNNWFKHVSKMYADSAQHYGPQGYFTSVTNNGIIEGFVWYYDYGGRQDYVTYFLHGREVTIELSNDFLPATESLQTYWDANRPSLLHFAQQAMFGISGRVTSLANNMPIADATIEIPGHDTLNSYVVTNSNGCFHRLIFLGAYNLKVWKGHDTVFVSSIATLKTATKFLDIAIDYKEGIGLYANSQIWAYPNPFAEWLGIMLPNNDGKNCISVVDLTGRTVLSAISDQARQIRLNSTNLKPGIYLIEVVNSNKLLYRAKMAKQ